MITLKNFKESGYGTVQAYIDRAVLATKVNPHYRCNCDIRTYPRSNEIYEDFLDGLNLENKRVLTVGSSGDQILAYTLLGSKDITVMDSNPITPLFATLKMVAIKHLTREEYIAFFGNKLKPTFFDKTVYLEKLRPHLDPECAEFWDEIIEKELYKQMFHPREIMYDLPPQSFLANDENYNKVRESIDDVNVTFVLTDFSNFHEYADGEYDFIDISNIYLYFDDKELFFKEIDLLYPHLSENGFFKLFYEDESEIEKNKVFEIYGKEYFYSKIKHLARSFIIWQNSPELRKQKLEEPDAD